MGLKALLKLLLFVLVLGLVAIFIFIPSPIKVSKQMRTKGTEKNLYFLMSNADNWKLWLEKDSVHTGFTYRFIENRFPNIVIEAINSDRKIPIKIQLHQVVKSDSTDLRWHSEIMVGYNPWRRLQEYLNARKLKKDFTERIKRFSEYTSSTKNLYGLDIVETKLKDTIIATLGKIEQAPPTSEQICIMLNELRQEIYKAGLKIIDSSMQVVQLTTVSNYKMTVGFPVNKRPEANSILVIKKMIPGKLLTGTVFGGPAAIGRGNEQMKRYISDHDKEEVALPYEISVINRCMETDTSKWITKLCYPVY